MYFLMQRFYKTASILQYELNAPVFAAM